MAGTVRSGAAPDAPAAAEDKPTLTVRAPGRAAVTGVVLLLHGGEVDSVEPVRPWSIALARMRMFISPLQTRSVGKGVAVALLRDRHKGWNGSAADARADALWALDRLAERYGPVPVALIGHSMGGRAALGAGGHPSVTGVAALAPWTPDGEPVEHLIGRTVLIAHGDLDRSVAPAESLAFARRARKAGVHVCRLRVEGSGHTMLTRLADWNVLAADFALAMVGANPLPEPVIAAFAEQAEQAKRFAAAEAGDAGGTGEGADGGSSEAVAIVTHGSDEVMESASSQEGVVSEFDDLDMPLPRDWRRRWH